jgi:hypothetical protein
MAFSEAKTLLDELLTLDRVMRVAWCHTRMYHLPAEAYKLPFFSKD